jgi:hypothetical protein
VILVEIGFAGLPPSEEMIAGERAKRESNKAVRDTQDRMARTSGRPVSFTEAMKVARQENPGLIQAYQSIALPNPVLRGRTV